MYDQADCSTKNFSARSRRPITKKLQNRPIMFGFGHSLVVTKCKVTFVFAVAKFSIIYHFLSIAFAI